MNGRISNLLPPHCLPGNVFSQAAVMFIATLCFRSNLLLCLLLPQEAAKLLQGADIVLHAGDVGHHGGAASKCVRGGVL